MAIGAPGEYGCVNDDNNESEINHNRSSVKEKGGGVLQRKRQVKAQTKEVESQAGRR